MKFVGPYTVLLYPFFKKGPYSTNVLIYGEQVIWGIEDNDNIYLGIFAKTNSNFRID